jgi:regulator of protease activity HflC (stomatin/prohibitin superfamily)
MKIKLIALLSLMLMSTTACQHIESGHVGVMVDKLSGKLSDNVLSPGLNVTGFFKDVYMFPNGVTDNINLNDFNANTKEGQQVKFDIRVQYAANMTSENANSLFLRYRKPFDGDNGIVQTRWMPIIAQIAGYGISQCSVVEIYQTHGAKASAMMSHILQNGLKTNSLEIEGIGKDYVTVQTVAISDIKLPENISEAVQRKAKIDQETLAAKQELQKTQILAQKQMIEANAEANASIARAKGQATARRSLGISPSEYTSIEKAKILADAIKHSPNLMLIPSNSLLDARELKGLVTSGESK